MKKETNRLSNRIIAFCFVAVSVIFLGFVENAKLQLGLSDFRIDLPKDHVAYNDCRNLNRYVFKLETTFKGDKPSSYFQESNITKSREYLNICIEKTQGESHNWKPYSEFIDQIEQKYRAISGASAVKDEPKNTNSTSTSTSKSSRTSSKNELKLELKVYQKNFEALFNERGLREKDIGVINVDGFQYEESANNLDLEIARKKFDEYKELNNGVAYGMTKIKSVQFFEENYDEFVQIIVLKKVQKLLDDSYNNNRYGASELGSLKLAQEALAFLNGADKFSDVSEIASLKSEAQNRVKELQGNLSKGLTGDFHTANVGKLLFSKKYIPYNELKNATTNDFTTEFGSGDEIWAYFFAPGSVGEIGKKDRIEGSIRLANASDNGVLTSSLIVFKDGREFSSFKLGAIPNVSPAQDLTKSVFIIPIAPGEDFFKSDFYANMVTGGFVNRGAGSGSGKFRYAGIYNDLKELPPRKIKLEIEFGEYTYGSRLNLKSQLSITVDRNYYADMYKKSIATATKDVKMQKKTGSNPAVEQQIKQKVSAFGEPIRVVQFTSTTVVKHAITGIPDHKYQHYQVAYKSKDDGVCYLKVYEHMMNYVGGKWVDSGVKDITPSDVKEVIPCNNINQ